MELNLENFSLGDYTLKGKPNTIKTDVKDYNNGYAIIISNRIVSTIIIYTNTGFNDFKNFQGKILFKKNTIYLNKSTQPDDIKILFGFPNEFWDDGVEVNYQFIIQDITIEFSWTYFCNDNTKPLYLNYLSIEI